MDMNLVNYLLALLEIEEAQATLKAIEAEKAQFEANKPEGYDAFCAFLDGMDDDDEV
jgi:hypothetical protein